MLAFSVVMFRVHIRTLCLLSFVECLHDPVEAARVRVTCLPMFKMPRGRFPSFIEVVFALSGRELLSGLDEVKRYAISSVALRTRRGISPEQFDGEWVLGVAAALPFRSRISISLAINVAWGIIFYPARSNRIDVTYGLL